MTQDEIIEMARQAGIIFGYPAYHDRIEIFAKLVAAKEREICAQICENEAVEKDYFGTDGYMALTEAAQVIRARGEA